MNFMGKAFAIMAGVGLAGIGVLFCMMVLNFEQTSTEDLGWKFLLLPLGGMLALSGAYLVFRGVTAPARYISPTGTGETSKPN